MIDAGVRLVPTDASHLDVAVDDERETLVVHTSTRSLTPSAIARLVRRHSESGLLVVPSATGAARRAAESAGWSWLAVGEHRISGLLTLGLRRIAVGETDDAAATPPARGRSRHSYGSLTVARWLLQRPAANQQILARSVGISQPRVSQILDGFAGDGLVYRDSSGWVATDVGRLLDWWLAAYPGPGGISTLWYGLGSPYSQAQAVVDLLAHGDAAVSGDVAADIIAPWRTPASAVVYGRAGVDLTLAGLVPAGTGEATLEFTVPEDQSVFWPSTTPTDSVAITIADMVQVLWDVRRAPGPDSAEAASRLRDALRRTAVNGHR